MRFEMLYSKIHRAVVNGANLHYNGSITLDENLIKAAKLFVGQKVDIVNINNGERFSTYVIKGEAGSGAVCLNGAAARKVALGDVIIIIAYASLDKEEIEGFSPRVVFVNEQNQVAQIKEDCFKK